jgi:hypothetical protein
MKLLITSFVFSLISSFIPVMAQEMPGTLTVYGEAMLNIKPDEVVASFQMGSQDIEYDRTVNLLGEKSDQL